MLPPHWLFTFQTSSYGVQKIPALNSNPKFDIRNVWFAATSFWDLFLFPLQKKTFMHLSFCMFCHVWPAAFPYYPTVDSFKNHLVCVCLAELGDAVTHSSFVCWRLNLAITQFEVAPSLNSTPPSFLFPVPGALHCTANTVQCGSFLHVLWILIPVLTHPRLQPHSQKRALWAEYLLSKAP